MANTILVGAQWGDEGKGKVIDFLTEEVDVVVRYQGGSNAGHTVEIGDQQYILHLIPSGILHAGKTCVIGNGVVVDPVGLMKEIRDLSERGIETAGRLHVSDRAHMVLPYHKALDAGLESIRADGVKLGTTKRGIGPAYGDKVARTGFRMGDLVAPEFTDWVTERVRERNGELAALGAETLDEAEVVASCRTVADFLRPYIADTLVLLHRGIGDNPSILFEGAQGTMLDVDFGTYPFVTSSSATAGGACTGTGLPPQRIDRVIGVLKAYTTRVGEGPFPTELTDDIGEHLRSEGHEFGATTGRPRRCGWFDAVVARYSAMVNGVDYWAITKMDVLDKSPTLKLCVAYECDGVRHEYMPANIRAVQGCTPIYEEMPGWMTSTRDVGGYDELPPAAKAYVERICELTEVPVGVLSFGPNRASTIRMGV